MKTAAEHISVVYVPVQDGNDLRGMTPSPPLKRKWSKLRQLRWLASLIMSEYPGLRLYVEKGRYWRDGVFQYGLFQISYNHGGQSACTFDETWNELWGIKKGLDLAKYISLERRNHV